MEIHAILGIAFAAIKLRDNLRHNTRKSNSLIKCLQAVKAPLESIDHAERDRIQVSHDETLRLLKDVIDRAHELLQKQTKHQNPVVKTFQSTKVRDQFHEIQIDLQAHLQTLNLSVGVLSGVQLQKIQQGLDIIKEVNGEALEEHLSTLRENQGIILENQNTTHGNQRSMLGKADVALRNQDEMKANQDEMKTLLSNIIQAQLNMSGNVVGNNTYITNDHSTTTTNNNNNNVTNNYQDQRSNVSDSDYSRTIKPKKPEPYVKRKTKLHIAAEKGSLSEVEVALREYFIDHETPNGSTALLLAVENGHVEVVKELLLVGVDFTVKANQKAWMKVLEVGGNVGDRAIDDNDDDNDDLHLIPRFLEGGVDANGKFGKLEDILTPLDEIKILKGYEGESKKQALLKTLVDRYSGDNHGLSQGRAWQMLAFLRMIQNDEIDDEYWRRFQDFATCPDDDDRDATLLHECAKERTFLFDNNPRWTLALARALIKAGADLNANDTCGCTPLHLCAKKGHLELARALIEAGADVNAKEISVHTPLHLCALNGHLEVARALIEAGADVNAKNNYGRTPLYICADEGHLEIARALINAGADVNAKENVNARDDGRTPLYGNRTPLHLCASRGHLELARALINAGAGFDGLAGDLVVDLLRKISGLAS